MERLDWLAAFALAMFVLAIVAGVSLLFWVVELVKT